MIYELRVYRASPGKMRPLAERFRDHTLDAFQRHGIRSVGFWTNGIGGRTDELWYMVAFQDLAEREKQWASLAADPDWLLVLERSEQDGPLVLHMENRILQPTRWSPLP